MDKNKGQVADLGSVDLFDPSRYQSDVKVMGKGSGKRVIGGVSCETFVWQLRGSSKVTIKGQVKEMKADDLCLIPVDTKWDFDPENDAMVLVLQMDVKNRTRVGYSEL